MKGCADMPKKYYAVRNGRQIGIFNTWSDCQKQVTGFSGAEFKSFATLDEAKAYLTREDSPSAESLGGVAAYVDGSYLHSSKKFSFGAVIFTDGEELHFKKAFSDPELASMRNVAGEIKGAEFVMQYCAEHNIPAVDIYYDYAGIEKWCSGEWKTNKDGTKAYRDAYLEYSKKVKISFKKVKGHSGNKYNDLVDSLAKSALGIE